MHACSPSTATMGYSVVCKMPTYIRGEPPSVMKQLVGVNQVSYVQRTAKVENDPLKKLC